MVEMGCLSDGITAVSNMDSTKPKQMDFSGEGEDMAKTAWFLGLSELVGTLLLIAVGCSFVVLDFAPGSPVVHWIPDPGVRRALTGFLFGCTGGSIALSKVGKISGAHINPVVTLAFWFQQKLSGPVALVYMGAQFVGAILGAALLGVWGPWAHQTFYAATTPGPLGPEVAVLGEAITTFCLIVGLFIFVSHPRLRRFTPGIFPILYAIMVYLEAPWSGTSTNPARSLGPAVVAHLYTGLWVYAVGPLAGTILGLLVLRRLLPFFEWEIEVAKVYHFHHDPHHVFHRHPDQKNHDL